MFGHKNFSLATPVATPPAEDAAMPGANLVARRQPNRQQRAGVPVGGCGASESRPGKSVPNHALALLVCTFPLSLRSLLSSDIFGTPPSLQAITATNQRPIANDHHHLQSTHAMPYAGNYAPNVSVVVQNWYQFFSAPNFAPPRGSVSAPRIFFGPFPTHACFCPHLTK